MFLFRHDPKVKNSLICLKFELAAHAKQMGKVEKLTIPAGCFG